MQKKNFLSKVISSIFVVNTQFSTHTSTNEINPLNTKLISKLVSNGTIQSPEVEKVMKSIDRGDFSASDPYNDRPQPIGYHATISAPHMHAVALEYLKDHLKGAKKCLDVGSGSGYLTLAFSKLMKNPDAVSYGVEHIPELVKESIKNIDKNHASLIKSGRIVIKEGDGRKGLKEHAPYDAIHVGASSPDVPRELLEQLAPGGRMLIPVGINNQDFLVVDKDNQGKVTKKAVLGVVYIPLTSKEKQWPS